MLCPKRWHPPAQGHGEGGGWRLWLDKPGLQLPLARGWWGLEVVQPSVCWWRRYRSAEALEQVPPASPPRTQARAGLSEPHAWGCRSSGQSLAEPSPSYRSPGTRCKGSSLASPPSCHQGSTVSALIEKLGLQKVEQPPIPPPLSQNGWKPLLSFRLLPGSGRSNAYLSWRLLAKISGINHPPQDRAGKAAKENSWYFTLGERTGSHAAGQAASRAFASFKPQAVQKEMIQGSLWKRKTLLPSKAKGLHLPSDTLTLHQRGDHW